MKNSLIKAALCSATGISALVLAGPAFAQDAAPTPEQVEQPDAPSSAPEASESSETIIVLGSRIRRTEFNSPDPVTVISPELARAQGLFNTSEMLQNSPIAAGSAQITSAISSAFVTDGGVGTETLSLRGLGANRTLVLLNGRRAGPAGTRGAISAFDLNVMPQSIIKNVEILKTGASSVYGSDAVAGVVNLITKTKTNGLELDGFASVPMQSGGDQYRLTATWGKDFGNGHILATVDFNKRAALLRKDRGYLDCPEEYIFNRAGERVDIIDPRTGAPRCNDTLWGHVWTYDRNFRQSGLYQPSYGDNLGAYIPVNNPQDFTVPFGFYRVTFNTRYPAILPAGSTQDDAALLAAQRAMLSVQNVYHPFMSNSSVIPSTKRMTAYVDAAYEVSDKLKIGAELIYNNRKNTTQSYRQFYYLTGFTGNFVNGFGDPFSPGWAGRYYLSPTAITDHNSVRIDNDYYRGVLWADGQFGGFLEGWNYNGYVQYSRSDGRYTTDIIYKDAVDLHDYRTSSCVGTVLAAGQQCIDIDWNTPAFLRGELTQAQRTMLFGVDKGKTLYDQFVAEMSFSGKLIDLPAGAVQAAFGGAYRTDKINDTPGLQTRNGNSWGLTSAGITAGKTETWEIFAEGEVPLIYNTPLIKNFTLSGSGRVTNVKAIRASDGKTDNSTGNWTYSIGANWEVNDWLRFRARYGTSFRAPALFEQFLANQSSFLTQRQVDPCIGWQNNLTNGTITQRLANNCQAGAPTSGLLGVPGDHTGAGVGARITTGGGLGVLDPETSTAKTASVIFTPKFDFLPNTKINIAVDYFDINIKGEIATLSAASIVSGCYNSDFFPNEPLCALFDRVPAGAAGQFNINGVTATFININSQRNEGIDLTIDLEQDIGKLGTIQFLAQMNWQLTDKVELFNGNVVNKNGENGEPKWVGDFNVIWSPSDTLKIFYGLDVIGKTSEEKDYIAVLGSLCRTSSGYGEFCAKLTTPTVFYHSLSLNKEIADGAYEITAGVSNLFDRKPPRVTVEGSNSLNGGVLSTVGKSILASQFDYLGRRAFVAFSAKF
ncbi:MAG: TonB-dependent receptor [Betaproteobacteria bacterium]|nr:TonB-dependent receptor [Betaproteobacteria bacterium]